MHVMVVTYPGEDDSEVRRYFATLKEAHTFAKNLPRDPHIRIEQVDIPTNKDGILKILNVDLQPSDVTSLRVWGLTPRGGLENG